jgi:hypothetical protein
MSVTISQTLPPERVTAPADLVRMANCPHCWQRPGRPCTNSGPVGDHLARWQRAERRGLIGRQDLAAVVAGLEVIAGHVIVREVPS